MRQLVTICNAMCVPNHRKQKININININKRVFSFTEREKEGTLIDRQE